MTIYAVGGEADCYEFVSGQAFAFDAGTGAAFDSAASRGALKARSGTSEFELFMAANQTEVWTHMEIYVEALSAVTNWIKWKTLANADAFRLKIAANGTLTGSVMRSASFVDLASSSVGDIPATTLIALDIYIKRHASLGEFTVYKNGVSILTFTGDTSGDASNFGRLHFLGGADGTHELYVSQVVMASVSTIGWKLATMAPSGAGNHSAWTGAYTDVDEADLSTGDFIETASTGDLETFTNTNIDGSFASYSVKAVAVAARANNDAASAISDLKAVVRISSTDYVSSDLGLPHDGTTNSKQAIWETSPATSSAWTQAELNGSEFGVKSV